MIPIFDLKRQYRELKEQIDAAAISVFESGTFINGPNVAIFESEIAAYHGLPHAVGLNSGTDALYLALRALNIGPGDEVITTAFTFVATTEAIGLVGATPVFADIDPRTYNIDPSAIEAAITPRTVAIIPVHLYGHPAPMMQIMEIANRRGLAVIEDCAQAIGAKSDGKLAGTIGTIGCYSFFPSKNLGAFGDGGLALTRDASLDKRLRALRAHGGAVKYHHDELGLNSRLDELQAAILRVKLLHLNRWIDARRAHARRYTGGLQDIVKTPVEKSWAQHVYHQYTISVENRDAVQMALRENGVQTMIYYPVPLHLQRVHENLNYCLGSLPHAETAARNVLSLPMFPELEESEQERVVEVVRNVVSGVGTGVAESVGA